MARHPLIVIEGINCAGKDTLAEALRDALHPGVIEARRPSSNDAGALIRNILREETLDPGAHALQLLFAADHWESARDTQDALKEGPVVCVRWTYSSVAYGVLGGLPRAWIAHLYQDFPVEPDAVLWLDVDPETAARREAKRNRGQRFVGDVVRQSRLRAVYTSLYEADAARGRIWHVLDANQDEAQVAARALAVVKPLLGREG